MADLSVVIPTHERAASLGRLLGSIEKSKGVGAIEVIVVDDGSKLGIYDGVQSRFPRVHWLRQERSGPAAARNLGWRHATCERIVFIDDDCVVEISTLDHLGRALDTYDAVGARIDPLHRGHLIADFMQAEHLVTHKVEDGRVRWLVTACLGIRRAALEALDGFDGGLAHGGEDVDLSLRLIDGGYRLEVDEDAAVAHDHRAGLMLLVRTYYRHGTAQRRLAARFPTRRADLKRSTRSRISPSSWRQVYRAYRRDQPVGRSLAFVALRGFMMVPWLVGSMRGQPGWADR